jgi:hypothetical protein
MGFVEDLNLNQNDFEQSCPLVGCGQHDCDGASASGRTSQITEKTLVG